MEADWLGVTSHECAKRKPGQRASSVPIEGVPLGTRDPVNRRSDERCMNPDAPSGPCRHNSVGWFYDGRPEALDRIPDDDGGEIREDLEREH